MTTPTPSSIMALKIDISKGLPQEISGYFAADEEQRQTLTKVLDLVHLDRFEVSYDIAAVAAGKFRVRGELQARLTQYCVISFEPVTSKVETPFDAMFWPQEAVTAWFAQQDMAEDGGRDEPEPYEGGELDLGQFFYELLATSIDPYPRKSGVEFRQPDPVETGKEDHPFAILKQLKKL